MTDYYAVLGLPKSASKADIRNAYRRLAMQWHPDKNPTPEAQQKFIAITEAYDALMSGKTFSFKSFSSTFVRPQPKPQKTAQDIRNEALAKQQERKRVLQKMRLERIMRARKTVQTSPNRPFLWLYYYGVAAFDFTCCAVFLLGPLVMAIVTLKLGWFLGMFLPGGAGAFYFGVCAKMRWLQARMLFGPTTDFLPDEIEDFFFFENRVGFWGAIPSGTTTKRMS